MTRAQRIEDAVLRWLEESHAHTLGEGAHPGPLHKRLGWEPGEFFDFRLTGRFPEPREGAL